MDKGIELLLERRKMYPEEFKKGGRWDTFLRVWDIDLDTPERHYGALRFKYTTLHEAVMRKLLEGEESDDGVPTIEKITKQTLKILGDELAKAHWINRGTP